MQKKFNTPEAVLLDALYDLQMLRELSEKDLEPAVMGNEVFSECNVIKDAKTKDRIVISGLPKDPAEFESATVWFSNHDYGVAIDSGKWQASPKDIIFWIDKALKVKYHNPEHGCVIDFDTEKLAEMLSFPNIKPIAQSEVDPRDLPEALEIISVPKTDSYTLASRIADNNYEQGYSFEVKKYGLVDYNVNKSTTFDIKLEEVQYDKKILLDEFDREFQIEIQLGKVFNLPVTPWGEPETSINESSISAKLVRDGIIMYGTKNGKSISYIPSSITQRFINNILRYASEA